MNGSFIDLLAVHRGHFRVESGMHGDVWFDLEEAYTKPKGLETFTVELSRMVAPYEADAVCGALVGGAFVGYSVALELGIEFMYTERFEKRLSNGERKVEYRLAKGFQLVTAGKRVAVIDDVINAGSAALKTCQELIRYGARPLVLGSLLTVGGKRPKALPGNDLPIVALDHLESNLWQPDNCPLCIAGQRLVDPYES